MRVYQTKGVARTTMTDIAREAGVSRQTVYNVFPNTDAMLRGALLHYIDVLWQGILLEWSACATLGEKLDVLFDHFAMKPWEYLKSSPVAAELERGYNAVGRAAIDEARQGFRDDVAALFQPWETELARQGTNPLAVSNYINAAIEGVKYNNDTRDDMTIAVATLKASLLAMVGQSA
jgi:AcrR family transcriptional regulator